MAGLSHGAAAIKQGVPIAAGCSGGETSKTSGQRGREQPGLAVMQGSGCSVSHGRQRRCWPMLGDKCLAASLHHTVHIPSGGGKAPQTPTSSAALSLSPLHSVTVSLLLLRGLESGLHQRNRCVQQKCFLWPQPQTPFYCLINNTPRTRSRPSEDSTLLLPCSFKKAFIKIKKKTSQWSCTEKTQRCFQRGSAAARKHTVLSHPHLQQTAKSISQPLLIKKKTLLQRHIRMPRKT